jgi:hypothetical protein
MNILKTMKPLFWTILLIFAAAASHAEVSPGDVVNKTNWQSVQGLVPDSVLNWVKNGDVELNISKLNYSPYDYAKAVVEKTFESNKGKYKIQNDVIVEASTGKEPEFVLGWPFPVIDPKEPDAAIKCIYNRQYLVLGYGNVAIPNLDFIFVDKTKGLVRTANMA